MSTNKISSTDIKRAWQVIDAKDQVLGRLSTQIAKILMGRNKVNYVPYLDMGDYVIVLNAAQVKVTGKKEDQKVYFRHSGYPGGAKREGLKDLRARKPEDIIKHAVKGMMPGSKLGKEMIKKLHIYKGETHPYSDKLGKTTKVEGEKINA